MKLAGLEERTFSVSYRTHLLNKNITPGPTVNVQCLTGAGCDAGMHLGFKVENRDLHSCEEGAF